MHKDFPISKIQEGPRNAFELINPHSNHRSVTEQTQEGCSVLPHLWASFFLWWEAQKRGTIWPSPWCGIVWLRTCHRTRHGTVALWHKDGQGGEQSHHPERPQSLLLAYRKCWILKVSVLHCFLARYLEKVLWILSFLSHKPSIPAADHRDQDLASVKGTKHKAHIEMQRKACPDHP